MNSGKTKLRLVKSTKRLKQNPNKKIPRNVNSAFKRALKEAAENSWKSVLIIGADNSLFHSPMKYATLIGLLEMNKHATIQEWLND